MGELLKVQVICVTTGLKVLSTVHFSVHVFKRCPFKWRILYLVASIRMIRLA